MIEGASLGVPRGYFAHLIIIVSFTSQQINYTSFLGYPPQIEQVNIRHVFSAECIPAVEYSRSNDMPG